MNNYKYFCRVLLTFRILEFLFLFSTSYNFVETSFLKGML